MLFYCLESSPFMFNVDIVEGVGLSHFEDLEVSEMQLKTSFFRLLFEWSTVLGLSVIGSIVQVIESLSFACIL